MILVKVVVRDIEFAFPSSLECRLDCWDFPFWTMIWEETDFHNSALILTRGFVTGLNLVAISRRIYEARVIFT
jgi:hypothetical protein